MRLLKAFLVLVIYLNPYIANGHQARAVFRHFVQTDEDSILFQPGFAPGILLPAGEFVEFIIPEEFRQRLPNYAVIKHRKDRSFIDDLTAFDENSPWISVQFRNPVNGQWHYWADQFGHEKRVAAASWRRPKQNTLYNFPEYVGNFAPDRIRVSNRGSGDLNQAVASFHSIEMVYLTGEDRCVDGIKRVFASGRQLNRLTFMYSLDEATGLELRPGQSFEFILPEAFAGHEILHFIVKHRKDPKFAADPENFDAYDENAAYILCEARSSKSFNWHRWADRSSFAKFSEVRHANNPENETLHNCLRTFGRIQPDMLRLTNVGKGDPTLAVANIHAIEVTFAPKAKIVKTMQEILTPETAFSNIAAGQPVPLLGGGPRIEGRFPGAVVLGSGRQARMHAISQLPERHRFETRAAVEFGRVTDEGHLLLSLPAGLRLEIIEFAIGDLDNTSLEYNKDGYFGRSGMAQASVYLVSSDGESIRLLENNNIGMAGWVICGGPLSSNLTRKGDSLLLKIENDEAMLMAYRLSFSQ